MAPQVPAHALRKATWHHGRLAWCHGGARGRVTAPAGSCAAQAKGNRSCPWIALLELTLSETSSWAESGARELRPGPAIFGNVASRPSVGTTSPQVTCPTHFCSGTCIPKLLVLIHAHAVMASWLGIPLLRKCLLLLLTAWYLGHTPHCEHTDLLPWVARRHWVNAGARVARKTGARPRRALRGGRLAAGGFELSVYGGSGLQESSGSYPICRTGPSAAAPAGQGTRLRAPRRICAVNRRRGPRLTNPRAQHSARGRA